MAFNTAQSPVRDTNGVFYNNLNGGSGDNMGNINTTVSSRSLVPFSSSSSVIDNNNDAHYNGSAMSVGSPALSDTLIPLKSYDTVVTAAAKIEPFASHLRADDLEAFLAQLGLRPRPSVVSRTVGGSFKSNTSVVRSTSKSPVSEKFLSLEELWLLINASKANAAKNAVRTQNWPVTHPIRKSLWKWLCRRLFLYDAEWDQVVALYRETLPMIFGTDERRLRDVPLPSCIDRSLMETYFLNEVGQEKAKKVVCVLSYLKPGITYSPYIYPVVAMLLHYIEDEAECFACIDSILEPRKKVARLYLSETRSAWKASGEALQELTRKRAKSTHSQIMQQQAKLKKVASTTSMAGAAKINWQAHQAFDNWTSYIFKHLPFDYLVRIMDCFLYEGMKVLFRTALALLKLYSKQGRELKKTRTMSCFNACDCCCSKRSKMTNNEAEMKNLCRIEQNNNTAHTLPLNEGMRRFCVHIRDYYTADDLLRAGFAISRLSQSEIVKFVSRFEKDIVERERRGERIDGYPYTTDDFGASGDMNMKRSQSGNRILALMDERSLGLAINDRQAIDWERLFPGSGITDSKTFFHLWNWLPARHQLCMPKLLFSTDTHGQSMLTFFHRLADEEPTIMLVKTTRGEIFGAYCSAAWSERGNKRTFFGTGESFIFTLAPQKVRYSWVGAKNPQSGGPQQSMFQSADSKTVIVGGGSTGQAIRFDNGSFEQGRSQSCTTFENPPLAGSGAGEEDFISSIVEVYGMTEYAA